VGFGVLSQGTRIPFRNFLEALPLCFKRNTSTVPHRQDRSYNWLLVYYHCQTEGQTYRHHNRVAYCFLRLYRRAEAKQKQQQTAYLVSVRSPRTPHPDRLSRFLPTLLQSTPTTQVRTGKSLINCSFEHEKS